MTNQIATRIRIGEVRFCYCHVFEPDKGLNPNGDAKYNVTMLIDKTDKALIDKINAAIEAAHQQGITGVFKGNDRGWTSPLHDGDADRAGEPFYEGLCYLKASTKFKPDVVKPGRVNGQNAAVPISNEDEFYAGCYGYAVVNFFAYNSAGNKGVSASLISVFKTKDGEPFTGGSNANEDYGDLANNLGDLPFGDDVE